MTKMIEAIRERTSDEKEVVVHYEDQKRLAPVNRKGQNIKLCMPYSIQILLNISELP